MARTGRELRPCWPGKTAICRCQDLRPSAKESTCRFLSYQQLLYFASSGAVCCLPSWSSVYEPFSRISEIGTVLYPFSEKFRRISGKASGVCSPALWNKTIEPEATLLVTRLVISAAEMPFQSRLSLSHVKESLLVERAAGFLCVSQDLPPSANNGLTRRQSAHSI